MIAVSVDGQAFEADTPPKSSDDDDGPRTGDGLGGL